MQVVLGECVLTNFASEVYNNNFRADDEKAMVSRSCFVDTVLFIILANVLIPRYSHVLCPGSSAIVLVRAMANILPDVDVLKSPAFVRVGTFVPMSQSSVLTWFAKRTPIWNFG